MYIAAELSFGVANKSAHVVGNWERGHEALLEVQPTTLLGVQIRVSARSDQDTRQPSPEEGRPRNGLQGTGSVMDHGSTQTDPWSAGDPHGVALRGRVENRETIVVCSASTARDERRRREESLLFSRARSQQARELRPAR
ncbi:hypothetical protein CIRG_04958 [Coccidioides immitis RMSCC 2394]|uniref:Uncharacterized protein n=1 Tax=Coccidioides immitis RMSCC 2394 TaxID=404692 RepID=A0A0J6Y9E5_COCIT|nr:hypothetical protein CIRG_04958 [Coccidioides immitis RMSCC 2394]